MICKEYGWTFDEYLDAPVGLIDATLARLRVESVMREREDQKTQAELERSRIKAQSSSRRR